MNFVFTLRIVVRPKPDQLDCLLCPWMQMFFANGLHIGSFQMFSVTLIPSVIQYGEDITLYHYTQEYVVDCWTRGNLQYHLRSPSLTWHNFSMIVLMRSIAICGAWNNNLKLVSHSLKQEHFYRLSLASPL